MFRMPLFTVWCKTYQEWEKDDCFLDKYGTLHQLKDSKLIPCMDPTKHTIYFNSEFLGTVKGV